MRTTPSEQALVLQCCHLAAPGRGCSHLPAAGCWNCPCPIDPPFILGEQKKSYMEKKLHPPLSFTLLSETKKKRTTPDNINQKNFRNAIASARPFNVGGSGAGACLGPWQASTLKGRAPTNARQERQEKKKYSESLRKAICERISLVHNHRSGNPSISNPFQTTRSGPLAGI